MRHEEGSVQVNRTYIGLAAAGALTLTFLAGTAFARWVPSEAQASPGYRVSVAPAVQVRSGGAPALSTAEAPAPATPGAPWNDPDRQSFMNRMMGGAAPAITPELAQEMGEMHARMHGGDPQQAAEWIQQNCGGVQDGAGQSGANSEVSTQ